MTVSDNEQIQADFARLSQDSDAAARCFYQRLFEQNPELRALFSSDIDQQGKKLMNTLAVAVQSLDRLEQLQPVLQKLGRDHQGYGVKPEHYPQVGAALIWMLQQRLGSGFDDAASARWSRLYDWVATQMQS